MLEQPSVSEVSKYVSKMRNKLLLGPAFDAKGHSRPRFVVAMVPVARYLSDRSSALEQHLQGDAPAPCTPANKLSFNELKTALKETKKVATQECRQKRKLESELGVVNEQLQQLQSKSKNAMSEAVKAKVKAVVDALKKRRRDKAKGPHPLASAVASTALHASVICSVLCFAEIREGENAKVTALYEGRVTRLKSLKNAALRCKCCIVCTTYLLYG